jgi:CubicO group peptidase (beta-lactamase class C family)
MTFANRFAPAAAAALFASMAAAAGDIEHKTLPGVSPEPIKEGAGLRSKEDLEAFLDGVMPAHLRAQHAAGATLSVVKDGKLFFTRGYGLADVEKRIPVDPDKHLFRPGSTSKLFTWTAVMQLVEQGKLKLDDDVNTYLKDFKVPENWGKPITIKNLMTHTEGLEDGGFGYLIDKEPQKLSLAEALAAHMPARVRPPTTDFSDAMNSSYSNWGTALAGHIVATVSGMPFDDYIKKNIFDPLGMTSSSFAEPLPKELADRMSVGYTYKHGNFKAHGFEYIHSFGPAGSLSSTAPDMAKFMIAHLQNGEYEGKRILKEETAKLMHTRTLSPNPYVSGTALGFYEEFINGYRFICHAGDTVYFHSNLCILPEQNIGMFVSYNTGPTLQFSARDDLLKVFMERYYPARLPVVKPPADFKERAAKFAGSYRVIRHNYTKNERMFAMLGSLSVAPTEDNTLVIASSGAPVASQFVEVKPNLFRKVDDQEFIYFPEENGKVTGFEWPFPFHAVYKVKWYDSSGLHGLIAGFAVLCFVVAVVSALRNWKADRAAPEGARLARRLAALLSVLYAVFLVLLVATFARDTEELLYGWPATFKIALAMPLLAIPLTLGVLYFAWRGWQSGWWTRYGRFQYSAIALGCTAFLWSLYYMNLVGYHFG